MPPKWLRSAERLLGQRDRFTQSQVRKEFTEFCERHDAPSSSLAFDPPHQGYLTPVVDRRYSVVWYLEDDTPVVKAVIPTTRFDESMDDLKERVVRAVERESDGTVALE